MTEPANELSAHILARQASEAERRNLVEQRKAAEEAESARRVADFVEIMQRSSVPFSKPFYGTESLNGWIIYDASPEYTVKDERHYAVTGLAVHPDGSLFEFEVHTDLDPLTNQTHYSIKTHASVSYPKTQFAGSSGLERLGRIAEHYIATSSAEAADASE